MYTMRPSAFEYHRPASIDEAVELLRANGDTRVLAGGHSLLPAMKLRLATPASIVDIGRIPGLDGIAQEGEELVVGALATHGSVATSGDVRFACPVLAETASLIGDTQVRSLGTIGGSLANADPGADYPTVVKALGATIVVTGKSGERRIPADEFFVDVFTTALQPGELLTSVRLPVTGSGTGASYRKHRNPASGYAVVGAAAVVSVEGGSCSRARLVVGGATGAPIAVPTDDLVGGRVSEEAIAQAAARVPDVLTSPLDDVYASGEYRRHLAQVLARRALTQAFERAA
jgi:aerobic carbon-monoxide dehydrogenase medium subunit